MKARIARITDVSNFNTENLEGRGNINREWDKVKYENSDVKVRRWINMN
jgi:hypothetical protein